MRKTIIDRARRTGIGRSVAAAPMLARRQACYGRSARRGEEGRDATPGRLADAPAAPHRAWKVQGRPEATTPRTGHCCCAGWNGPMPEGADIGGRRRRYRQSPAGVVRTTGTSPNRPVPGQPAFDRTSVLAASRPGSCRPRNAYGAGAVLRWRGRSLRRSYPASAALGAAIASGDGARRISNRRDRVPPAPGHRRSASVRRPGRGARAGSPATGARRRD